MLSEIYILSKYLVPLLIRGKNMDFLNTIWQPINVLIGSFKPTDLIDIVLVAFLTFKVIQLVRETRAEQLLKGLVILGLAYFIANLLQLRTFNFIMVNVFQIGLLALIVVFQPELRRALERVGRSKFTKIGVFGLNVDTEEEAYKKGLAAINEVCEAALALRRNKMGALIVFERETKLGDIIDTGTVINADISASLISNLFWNKALLHDGAMIIRNGRIYAAGCILPLSNNDIISRELGTRHRAALGMSENSDAVVLVVSEELGSFSIAENGHLSRNLSIDAVKNTLIKSSLSPVENTADKDKSPFWKFWRAKDK